MTSSDSATPVDSLRYAAQQLNQAADNANEVVRETEEFLGDTCGIGVEKFVKVWADTHRACSLGYARHDGKFRIIVKVDSRDGEYDLFKPWLESPRELKLSTVTGLPNLIDEIAEELNAGVALAKKAEEAISEVRKRLFAAMSSEEKFVTLGPLAAPRRKDTGYGSDDTEPSNALSGIGTIGLADAEGKETNAFNTLVEDTPNNALADRMSKNALLTKRDTKTGAHISTKQSTRKGK